jgi:hypothetical protein
MSNSITGRCWTVDTAAALTTEPTRIMAIQLNPNAADDVITFTDTAGVRIAQIQNNADASLYQVFPYPGVFGKGVTVSALSTSATAIVYIY